MYRKDWCFKKIAKFCEKTGMHWEFMHTKQWRTPILTETMHHGDCWRKWTNKPPTHHERLMVCGQETLFCCIPVLQLTTVVSYVLTYAVTTRCLTYLLNYLSNQLYALPTYIWYSPQLMPFSQNCYLATFWNLLLLVFRTVVLLKIIIVRFWKILLSAIFLSS